MYLDKCFASWVVFYLLKFILQVADFFKGCVSVKKDIFLLQVSAA